MIAARDQIEVEASPEDVFAFMDEPSKQVKITPSLVEVTDVRRLANGGKQAEYTYTLAGVELGGTVRDIERQPPNRLVQSLSGAIDGTIRHTFEAVDAGTLVTYAAEYDLPQTVLESVLEPIVRTYNEKEVEATLANLKAHLEA